MDTITQLHKDSDGDIGEDNLDNIATQSLDHRIEDKVILDTKDKPKLSMGQEESSINELSKESLTFNNKEDKERWMMGSARLKPRHSLSFLESVEEALVKKRNNQEHKRHASIVALTQFQFVANAHPSLENNEILKKKVHDRLFRQAGERLGRHKQAVRRASVSIDKLSSGRRRKSSANSSSIAFEAQLVMFEEAERKEQRRASKRARFDAELDARREKSKLTAESHAMYVRRTRREVAHAFDAVDTTRVGSLTSDQYIKAFQLLGLLEQFEKWNLDGEGTKAELNSFVTQLEKAIRDDDMRQRHVRRPSLQRRAQSASRRQSVAPLNNSRRASRDSSRVVSNRGSRQGSCSPSKRGSIDAQFLFDSSSRSPSPDTLRRMVERQRARQKAMVDKLFEIMLSESALEEMSCGSPEGGRISYLAFYRYAILLLNKSLYDAMKKRTFDDAMKLSDVIANALVIVSRAPAIEARQTGECNALDRPLDSRFFLFGDVFVAMAAIARLNRPAFFSRQHRYDEMADWFVPEIAARSHTLDARRRRLNGTTNQPRFEELYARAREIMFQRDRLLLNHVENQLAACTFEPKISSRKRRNLIAASSSMINLPSHVETNQQQGENSVQEEEYVHDDHQNSLDSAIVNSELVGQVQVHAANDSGDVSDTPIYVPVKGSRLCLRRVLDCKNRPHGYEESVRRMQRAIHKRNEDQHRYNTLGTKFAAAYDSRVQHNIASGQRTAADIKPFSFWNTKKRTKQPILYVDVHVRAGRTGRIGVYPGDSAAQLAHSFAVAYQLDARATSKLVKLLQHHIDLFEHASSSSRSLVAPPPEVDSAPYTELEHEI